MMKLQSFTLKLTLALLLIMVFAVPAFSQETEDRNEGWFYADEHPEITEALGDHEYAAGVLEALSDSGTNWTELWDAISSQQGNLWSYACWLVINMPHLDRIEMTEDILLDHVRFAYASRTDLSYVAPQELFREFILTYRIGDEPVRMWRSNIWLEFNELVGETTAETARNINRWVFENLEVRERGFFGPRPDPWSVITAGTGTESDIAGVAIAMCKTFGVPARRTMIEVLGQESGGATWLEIYSDGEWIPMYPDNPDAFGDRGYFERENSHNVTVVSVSAAFTHEQVTSQYTGTGTLSLHFTRNDETVVDFEHFTISAWNDGAWLPLDDIWYDLSEDMTPEETGDGFVTVLGDGFYIVQTGVRNSRGDAFVRTLPVMIEAGSVTEVTVTLDIPVSLSEAVDLVQRNIDPLPELDLAYADPTTAVNFPAGLSPDTYTCIVIFDPAQEPSIRMLPMIAQWTADQGASLIGIGIGDPALASDFFSGTMSADSGTALFYSDPDGTIAAAFGLSPNDEGIYGNLPFVMLLTPGQEIIYLRDGYDLAVTDGLARAIELAETE